MTPENPDAQNSAAEEELGEEQLDKVAGGFVDIDPPSEERIIVITDPASSSQTLLTPPRPQDVHPPA